MESQNILNQQRQYFSEGNTKSLQSRIDALVKLKNLLKQNEQELFTAAAKDSGKSQFDVYTTELAILYQELEYFIKKTKKLMRPKKVGTNLVNQLGKSYLHPEPLGNVLVIGAWNYPYLLALNPCIAALASGNTVILKPSEITPHCASILSFIINQHFEASIFRVIEGGLQETQELLQLKFNKIFFTGSPQVGKIVYKAAAEHLCPVTLELGGKSPVIVSQHANLAIAAQRIVWGKFLNAGQTCVAPDYILVDQKIAHSFLEILKSQIIQNNYQENSEHYVPIINLKNFNRVVQLIHPEKIYHGGKYNLENLYIEPTILYPTNLEDKVMQDEIFGPILPVIPYKNLDEAFAIIQSFPHPLSAYLFTDHPEEKKLFSKNISFGGGCINDVVMHLSNPNLPFGGVGNSGMGSYHGKYGFETFSHYKSILHRATFAEPKWKYPPYTLQKLQWIKRVLGG